MSAVNIPKNPPTFLISTNTDVCLKKIFLKYYIIKIGTLFLEFQKLLDLILKLEGNEVFEKFLTKFTKVLYEKNLITFLGVLLIGQISIERKNSTVMKMKTMNLQKLVLNNYY